MRKLWLVVVVMLSGMAMAQNCDVIVYDGANVLKGQEQQIETAAQGIIQKGGDVRVRTVLNATNLDLVESQYEKSCTSWMSPNGGRKSTLIVLMVAPKDRKMGIYYGAAWKKALDDHWNRIKAESMAPYFRNGDFSGGFIATENQLASRIAASQDEAVHPAVNQTVNQEAPVDLSGLWTFLMWCLLLSACGGGLAWLFSYLSKRRERSDELKSVQVLAIRYKNLAGQKINMLRTRTLDAENKNAFDNLVEQYADAGNSVKNDPTIDGLPVEVYRTQESLYHGIFHALAQVDHEHVIKKSVPKTTPTVDKPLATTKTKKAQSSKSIDETEAEWMETVRRKKETEKRESNTIIAPVIIGNEFGESERRRKSSYDDDSSSRSDSSWSSSDSGSGGSSDFGSSSSDSGGSSDFGGGGDSGGGGSSGF